MVHAKRMLFWLFVGLCGLPSQTMAQFTGVYPNKPGYAPGETIVIHGAAPNEIDIRLRLVDLRDQTKEYGRSEPTKAKPAPLGFGSFIEVPNLTMAGRKTLTLEGWWYPTMLGTDTVALIGQIGAKEAAVGIVITPEGKPAVYGSNTPATSTNHTATSPTPLTLDTWHHLAATFDGQRMRLYVDGKEVASKPFTTAIVDIKAPFRIGARSEAPGDMTGIIDGRIDAWAVWPKALTPNELKARIAAAKGDKDPAPPAADVLLYLGFEEGYQGIKDGSSKAHSLAINQSGVPHIAGVNKGSLGFGLHHDQLVDAKWPVIGRIKIPEDAPSGLYALQLLTGPNYAVTPNTPKNSIAIAIRPRTPKAKVAILVPVNTWNAYNSFPGKTYATEPTLGITARPRQPGGKTIFTGGNNSAYDTRGDGTSYAYFQGWHRPSSNAEPFRGNAQGFHQRAAISRFLFEWLDREGIAYDVYSDVDLHNGKMPTNDTHKVLIVHGHAEYWSRKMLSQTSTFLDNGGHVIALAANMLAWRVTIDDAKGMMEIRKWPTKSSIGDADDINAMDQKRAGAWLAIDLCDASKFAATFGGMTHMSHPCSPAPQCFGKWSVKEPGHWLWKGLGVKAGQTLGSTPVPGIFSVGHETEITHPAYPPLGILAGTSPTILAEGVSFPAPQTFRVNNLEKLSQLNCKTILDLAKGVNNFRINGGPNTRSGHIYTYRHKGGGHILVIGSTSAPWGLLGDKILSAMAKRAIDCFANGKGCPTLQPTEKRKEPSAAEPNQNTIQDAAAQETTPQRDAKANDAMPTENATPRTCGCQTQQPLGSFLLVLFCLIVLSHMRKGETQTR